MQMRLKRKKSGLRGRAATVAPMSADILQLFEQA
jgi:hypothetical protein